MFSPLWAGSRFIDIKANCEKDAESRKGQRKIATHRKRRKKGLQTVAKESA